MKTYFFLLLLVISTLCTSSLLDAQCTEQLWLNPKPSPENINAIHMASKDTVWLGADGGLLFLTINGGQSWNRIGHNIQANIQSIVFPEKNTGYLSSVNNNQSFIYKTSDGGISWNLVFDGYKQSLYGFVKELYFWHEDSGYAFFGTARILVTHNGGTTWTVRNTASGGQSPMVFTSKDTGFISASSQVIFKTVNGGNNWTSITIPSLSSQERIADFHFFNSNEGYAVSNNNRVLFTSNGGLNWTQLQLLSNFGRNIYFTDKDSGFILPNNANNVIYKTVDAGLTWPTITTPSNLRKHVIGFIDQVGYIAGEGGFIMKTTNYGHTWINQRVGSSFSFYSIVDDKLHSLYAAGTTGIMRSSNEGEKWDTIHTGAVNGVHFNSPTLGFYYGNNGLFRRTTNGGNTWNTITTSFSSQNLQHLDFNHNHIGAMVSSNGQIFKTTNGGTTWSSRPSGTTRSLQKIQFASDSLCYTAGNNGVVLRSNNGGETWINISIPDSFNLRTLSSPTPRCLFVGGSSSKLFVTYDSGNTWIQRNTSGYTVVRDVFFETEAVGYMVAGYNSDGYVLETLDSGKSWNLLYGNGRILLTALKTFKENLYVVGINGAILLIKKQVKRPSTSHGSRCDTGDLVLTAPSIAPLSTSWFSHPYLPTSLIGVGDSLVLPNLQQSTTYYASTFDSTTNCFSQRVPVEAQIIPLKKLHATIISSHDSICDNNSVELNIKTNAKLPFSTQWLLNHQPIDTSKNISINYLKRGDSLQLQLQTQEFCVDQNIIVSPPKSIYIHPLPEAAFHIDNPFQCQNSQHFTFLNQSRSNDPIITKRWVVDGRTYEEESTIPNRFSTAGPKEATLFIETIYGCSDSIKHSFMVLPKPQAHQISGPTHVTVQSEHTFMVLQADPLSYIDWSSNNGVGNSNSVSIQLQWITQGVDTLRAIEINTHGCMSDTLMHIINISPSSHVAFPKSLPLKLYPNPSYPTSPTFLQIPTALQHLTNLTLSVTDILGRQVFLTSVNTYEQTIEVMPDSMLKPGLYLVSLQGGGHYLSGHLIIKPQP
jgi:photosystem II stability/assembly factor-like uncharacterized protein